MSPGGGVGPEQIARIEIDRQLSEAGWTVQDRDGINLSASRGIAVREFKLDQGGFADYLLFVNGQAVGVVEAKPPGHTLRGVEPQAYDYSTGLPENLDAPGDRHSRKPTWSDDAPEGRWRAYDYEELINRDKVSLDLFWIRDESLEDSANLPDPDVLAQEIVDDLRSALGQIEDVLGDLEARVGGVGAADETSATGPPRPYSADAPES